MSTPIRPVFSSNVSAEAIERFKETVASIPEYRISSALEHVRINIADYDIDLPAERLRKEIDDDVSMGKREGYLILVIIDSSRKLELMLLATAPYWACKTLDDICRANNHSEPRTCRGADGCMVACTDKEDLARQILGRVYGLSNPSFWDLVENPEVCLYDVNFVSLSEAMWCTLEAIEDLDLNPQVEADEEELKSILVGCDSSIWPNPEHIDPAICNLLLEHFPNVTLSIRCKSCGEWLEHVRTESWQDGWRCEKCITEDPEDVKSELFADFEDPVGCFVEYLERSLNFSVALLSRVRIDADFSNDVTENYSVFLKRDKSPLFDMELSRGMRNELDGSYEYRVVFACLSPDGEKIEELRNAPIFKWQ